MNIFQISQELLDIFQELEETGGELTPELEEKLQVTQADFKTKIKNYTDVIKQAENDIDSVDKEIKRLQSLKKSKESAIDRINKVIIWAVDMFGDENKSGNKYVDFGTGKVLIKTTQKVEVDDDYAKNTIDKFIESLRALGFTKELYFSDLKDTININEEDIEGVIANISFDIPLKDVYSEHGYNIIKAFFENNKEFKAKPNISKTYLKDNLKDNPNAYPKLAHLINNKTITIK